MNYLLLFFIVLPLSVIIFKRVSLANKIKNHSTYDLENFKGRVAAELEESRKRREAKLLYQQRHPPKEMRKEE